MQFQDELAGGVVLIRPALQSPDYVTGVSGWAIKIDGSAEFSNVVIRGGGTSDPIVVGNPGSPQVIIRTTAGNGLIVFPTNRAIELQAATVGSAVVDPGAANERAELQLTGPTVNGATEGVRIVVRSQPNDASLPASFSVQDRTGTTTFFAVDKTEVRVVEMRIDSRQLAATGVVLAGYVTTDAVDRIKILASGEMQWSSGAAAADVRLYREAANILTTDDTLRVYRAAAGDNALSIRVDGDTTSRLFINANGSLNFGPGGGGASDASIARSGAATLAVTGALTVSSTLAVTGVLTAANIQSGTVDVTPTVANEWTANVAVAFPAAFATTPRVMVTCSAGAPGSATTTELELATASVTTTGFNVRIRRGNLTTTTLSWLAVST